MKVLFRLSIVLSLLSSISLHAAESTDYTLLLDQQLDGPFTFHRPKYKPFNSREEVFFSSQALYAICEHLKAGPPLSAEYDQEKKSLKLAYFEDDRFVVKELKANTFIKKIHCSAPSRELAFKFLENELAKSKNNFHVDIVFLKKIQTLYPELITLELAERFLHAEFNRASYRTQYNERNIDIPFIHLLLQLHPSLRYQFGDL